jgi:hypothetical protein
MAARLVALLGDHELFCIAFWFPGEGKPETIPIRWWAIPAKHQPDQTDFLAVFDTSPDPNAKKSGGNCLYRS